MCTCQSCKKKYKIDVLIPDDLWVKINPPNMIKGAGLLCGSCIFKKLEETEDYSAFKLIKT